MIIVQLTYKAQKWRIQNRYLNILDHTERPALPNSTLQTVDDWCIWIIAEIVNKNFKKIAYMKLFDMWPSALVGWNNINFHDLNTWASCTMPGSHIPVWKQKSTSLLHINKSLLMLFFQTVLRTVHNPQPCDHRTLEYDFFPKLGLHWRRFSRLVENLEHFDVASMLQITCRCANPN